MDKKIKKMLSLFLSIAMIVTMVTVPDITVKASFDAANGLNVYFKYTGDDGGWTTVALNTWDKTTVTAIDGGELENEKVLAWNEPNIFPKMTKNDNGWYEAKVTGATLNGIDFVYPINGDTQAASSAKEAKDAANFLKLPAGAENIYYVYNGTELKAYSDEACTKELDAGVVLHFVNTSNWNEVKVNYWGNITSANQNQQPISKDAKTGWYDIKIYPSNDSGSGLQFYTGNWTDECKLAQCFEDGVSEYWVVEDGSPETKNYSMYIKPTSVSVPETAEVVKGKTYKIPVTVSDRGFPDASFTSSDTDVATVDAAGLVTGIKEGTTTITVQSLADSSLKASCEVTVKPEIKVTEIKVSKETLQLKKDQATVLTADVLPENANKKDVTWTSSDTGVVTVDAASGKVAGVAAGTATVTATATDDSGVTGTCNVTVLDEEAVKAESAEIEAVDSILIAGDSVELKSKTTVLPENADYFNLTYTSSNEKVATVSEEGVVTAVGAGNATIAVNTDNDADNFKAGTCTITVGNKYSLRGDTIGWDEKDEYSFKYTGESSMQMKTTLELKKGFYSFQCAANGWNNKLGGGKNYDIYVNKDTIATVTITYTTNPDASDAQIIFTGTNADDITTEIPEKKEVYTVVGGIEGDEWDWYSNDRLMQLNEDTGLYEYTWTGLTSGTTYIYQLAQDGATFGYKYQINDEGKNFTYKPATPGSLHITYDAAAKKVSQEFIPSVTGVTLDKNTAEVLVGDTIELTATVMPEDAKNKNVTWSSDNEDVAVVAGGIVTAKSVGKANITVTTEDGQKTDTCEVTVNPIAVTGVSLNNTNVGIVKGNTVTLIATITPDNATDKSVSWSSSDEKVATVKDGVVTAVAAGTSTITVTTTDGKKTADCTVNVSDTVIPITGITISQKTLELTVGGNGTLSYSVTPEDANNRDTVEWSSSDERVATVKDGVVTAVGEGEATIKVTVNGTFTQECTVTVKAAVVSVVSIRLDKTEAEVAVGETVTLNPTVLPENATDKTYTWSTSDERVASVKDGIVTALAEGEATITVTTTDSKKTAECKVTVKPAVIPVSGITLDKTEAELPVGETVTLKATILPENATDKTYAWSSSDEKIATVKDGVVTAVAEGTATVTVTTTDGKKTAECKVAVKPAVVSVNGINLDKDVLELTKGQTETLKATVLPENATDKTYKWSSSDEKVADVKDGVVTAVSEGTATITVTTTDGKKTAECKVTVKAEIVYYTVTFKDGSEVLSVQSVEQGKSAKVPKVNSKTGYTLSWDKKFDNITSDVTVNTVWKANKYTVKFNKNGGTVSKTSKTVTYASKYGTLPTAERKGYVFSGWYTAKTGGKKVTSSTKVSTAKTHTLYARWTKVKVGKVSFKSLKAAKKQMTVAFKKVTGAKGYEIVYATNSKFKSAKKLTTKSTKATIKKLKSKSTIYVKIRAYKTDSTGNKVYGSYSSVKKVKIK